MEQAVQLADLERDPRLSDALKIHGTLMTSTERPERAGCLRVEQSWLGGAPHNPLAAEFIPRPHPHPPPPELVAPLMEDLLRFVAQTDLQASAPAAPRSPASERPSS